MPAVIGAYFRFKMDETPQFKAHVLAPQHMRERREDRREKGREEVQADEIENSSNDVEIQIQPDVTYPISSSPFFLSLFILFIIIYFYSIMMFVSIFFI